VNNQDGPAPTPLGPVMRVALGPLFRQEYLRIMRGRLAMLIWVMMVYAIVALPFIMQKPPPELVHLVGLWLGGGDVAVKIVLFMWVDASMNKFAVILGPALAGGIIIDERSRRMLDLFASKPIDPDDYFTVKLAAAGAALATFYAGGVAGAVAVFPWFVAHFDAGAFMLLSAVHLLAALYGVSFAATMAVVVRRKLASILVSLVVLGTLVGFAFLGFYHPTWRTVSYLNPFFGGVVLIGSIDDYGAGDVAWPVFLLVGFNVVTAAIGRRRASAAVRGA
jgi:ABC-2 type transport system permease protein